MNSKKNLALLFAAASLMAMASADVGAKACVPTPDGGCVGGGPAGGPLPPPPPPPNPIPKPLPAPKVVQR